ncbi:ankyrin repeat-containing domain protein [Sordaria brevicollis]|uniref:Ankyrin repeat-containing domain protein n=1 Tax=Sordaria brevicollis TaxID=83679 RepID=A0AAE0U333_SORBR|nr:ankyrin repeat-containing domain protein [Sordaria brevicollis]
MCMRTQQDPASTRQVFDTHCATSGFPMETCFEESIDANFPALVGHLKTQIETYLDFTFDSTRLSRERTLLSVASPVHPLCTLPSPDSIALASQIPEYKAWLKPDGPSMLHIHGISTLQEVSELIFLATRDYVNEQDSLLSRKPMVLYFSFDRWDCRRSSISAMVSTILAQIVCFEPQAWVNLHDLVDWQCYEHGWTEGDLLHWLLSFGASKTHGSVMLILNNFDLCAEDSQFAFLNRLSRFAAPENGSWKVAVTSNGSCSALENLPAGWCTALDVSRHPNLAIGLPGLQVDVQRFITYRPDLPLEKLEAIKSLSPCLRHLLVTQAPTFTEWPSGTSVASLQRAHDSLEGDAIIIAVLDQTFQRVANKKLLRRLLVLLVYATRPLSIWELDDALRVGCKPDGESTLHPGSPSDTFLRDSNAFPAGIIKLQNMEVSIDNSVRGVVMANNPFSDQHPHASSQHIWDDLLSTAHYDIADMCLDYLSDSVNNSAIDTIIRTGRKPGVHITEDHTTFCSYALKEWPYHFAQSSIAQQAVLIERFLRPYQRIEPQLACGHWALSNPITRIEPSPTTFFPLFAGLGLVDVWEPQHAEDATRGIIEAALRGQEKGVNILLESHPEEPTLLEILTAAASSGVESLLLHLIEHIKSKSKDLARITWPPVLLHRASRLDLTTLVQELLNLGCLPDVSFSDSKYSNLGPLAYAIFNHHQDTLRIMVRYPSLATIKQADGLTLLHHAAMCNNAKAIVLLIKEAQLDINAKCALGKTPLYVAANYAAHRGYERCAQLLLDHGADPNMGGQVSPLKAAVQLGHVGASRALLAYGADPESPLYQFSLLSEAIYCSANRYCPAKNGLSVCQLLLEHGVDVNTVNNNGSTAIHIAAFYHLPTFTKLLLEHGANPNKKDKDVITPLYRTIIARESSSEGLDVVRLLLQHKGDSNIACRGSTPLHAAVHNQSIPEFTSLLLGYNAELDAENEASNGYWSGWTPLFAAASTNKAVQMRMLVEAGANLRHKATDGRSPIHLSAVNDTLSSLLEYLPRLDINARLLNAGAKIDVVDAVGRTPLREAVASQDAAKVVYLLQKGSDPNLCDGLFGSPLSVAALHQSAEVFEILLKHGAAVNAKDVLGRQPIHYAAWSGVDNIERVLAAGGDTNARDKLGRTPLHWAARFGRLKVVERILAISPGLWFGSPESADEDRYVEVVQLLIDHGASLSTQITLEGKVCNPYQTAQLCGATLGVKWLLERRMRDEGIGQVVTASEASDKNHEVLRRNRNSDLCCAVCSWLIHGRIRKCRTCKPEVGFCFRCYPLCKSYHPSARNKSNPLDDNTPFEKPESQQSSSDSYDESSEDEYSDEDD